MTQQPPNDPYRNAVPPPQPPGQRPSWHPQAPPGQPVPPGQPIPSARHQPHPQQPPYSQQPPYPQQPQQPQQPGPWQELRQPGVVSGAVKDSMKSWAKGKLIGYGVMAAIVLLVAGPVFLWSMFGRSGGGPASSTTRDDAPAATSAATPGESKGGEGSSSDQPADAGVLQFTLPDGWRTEKEEASESGIMEYQVRQGDTWTILLAGYKPVEQDMTLAERCQEATQFEASGEQGNVEPVSISQSGDDAVKCEVSVNDAAMGGQEAVVTYYFLQKPGEDRYIEMRLSGPTPTNDLDITPADVKRTRDEGIQIVRGTAAAAGFEINP